ncbi:hypothetical protein [Parashewanella curva]|uniref:hypothetical protein n=1 Tax=Parashewanella curva TaxID=2338552 RepID=UPI001404B08F|nr:hypothetical protein [Parashewanella curva]
MHDITLLHETPVSQCPNIHKKRITTLMVGTTSLLNYNKLSITDLGRGIEGEVATK